MKKIILITYLLLSLSVLAHADSFELRDDIVFGDTIDIVVQKESLPTGSIEEGKNNYSYSVTTGKTSLFGIDGSTITYHFDKDKHLVDISYNFPMIANDEESATLDFKSVNDDLLKKYGDPIENEDPNRYEEIGSAYYQTDNIIDYMKENYSGKGKVLSSQEWVVDCENFFIKIDHVLAIIEANNTKAYTHYASFKCSNNITLSINEMNKKLELMEIKGNKVFSYSGKGEWDTLKFLNDLDYNIDGKDIIVCYDVTSNSFIICISDQNTLTGKVWSHSYLDKESEKEVTDYILSTSNIIFQADHDYMLSIVFLANDLSSPSFYYQYSPSFEDTTNSIHSYSDWEDFQTDCSNLIDSYFEMISKGFDFYDIDTFLSSYIPATKNDGNQNMSVTETQEFKTLSKGSLGEGVRAIQLKLIELNYLDGQADGNYGPKTEKAVSEFQKDAHLPVTGIADNETQIALFTTNQNDYSYDIGEVVFFKSVLMQSVLSQINSASDFMDTANDRAIIAALLSVEFIYQKPDFEIDYSLPIYVGNKDDLASVALGGKDGYVLIVFQKSPFSTSYSIIDGNNPSIVKQIFSTVCDSTWEVDLQQYNEKLALVNQQLAAQQ